MPRRNTHGGRGRPAVAEAGATGRCAPSPTSRPPRGGRGPARRRGGGDRQQPGLRRRRHPPARPHQRRPPGRRADGRRPARRRPAISRRPEFVRRHTGQAIGGVAPIGHPEPIGTLVDVELARHETVWAAAGHPATVFPTSYDELLRLTEGTPAEVGPAGRPPPPRPAGGERLDDRHQALHPCQSSCPSRWLRDHMHEALTIYGLAMGYDSAVVAGRYGYAIQHTDGPASGPSGRSPRRRTASSWSASATATSSRPASGGTTRSGPRLDRRTAKKWLPGAFEVCELHVHPDHQSQGLGRRLLHALVADLPLAAACCPPRTPTPRRSGSTTPTASSTWPAATTSPATPGPSRSSARASRCIHTAGPRR